MIFRKARHEELQELMKIYNRAVSYRKKRVIQTNGMTVILVKHKSSAI